MPLTDDRTEHLDLPLPHQFNDLPDDVERLRDALEALDTQAQTEDERFATLSDAFDAKVSSDDVLHGVLSDAIEALETSATSLGIRATSLEDRADALEAAVSALELEHEETITLIADQTVINLVELTSTDGATVFVEGIRLKKTEWTAHPTVVTRLTLSTTYPAGHEVTVVRRHA